MSQRDSNLLWLSDLLSQLKSCQKQLEWTTDAEAVHLLTETMIRDLECCRRLCETLQRRASLPAAV
ncbi:MAG: hypothetical protein K2R98_14840 [Gemmataceae bacterium]|nr:hypothetical protein [Gemmataceae bacterium]